MRTLRFLNAPRDDRYLLVDDTDEDAGQLLTVICEGDPRSYRGFDFEPYRDGGAR